MNSARRTAAALAGAAFMVVVIAFLAPRAEAACSCNAPPANEQGYVDQSDLAFDGIAVGKQGDSSTTTWSFHVNSQVKGTPSGDPQPVSSSSDTSMCGVQFDIGTTYRVYAKRNADNTYSTTACSGDHASGQTPPTSRPATTVRPATTAPVKAAPATLVPPATVASIVVPPTVATTEPPVTFALDSTTGPTVSNFAIKEEKPPHANRLVIGLILAAAAAAIGAGVVLWRRGP